MAMQVKGGGHRYELRSKRICGNAFHQSNHPIGDDFSDKSNSGDEDVDKTSEASRKEYAAIALRRYSFRHDKTCFELVEIGPLAEADYREGRIVHFNFTAKEKDKPGARVHGFFSEIIVSKLKVFDAMTFNLGPSDELPEEADTAGCLYCGSIPIHHPAWSLSFQVGREKQWEILCSKVKEIDEHINKRYGNPQDPNKGFERLSCFHHPGVVYLGGDSDSKAMRAREALRVYNEENGTNFKLVKAGSERCVFLMVGLVFHMNFKAKDQVSGAPMQTFFAEVISRGDSFFVEFCKCLAPSDARPGKRKVVELHGCCYCTETDIRHPPGPGYLIGRMALPET